MSSITSLRRELLIWKIAFVFVLITTMLLGAYVLGDLLMASTAASYYSR